MQVKKMKGMITLKIKRILFTKKNTAELVEEECPKTGDNDVLVKTAYSTISCGTEKANITASLTEDLDLQEGEEPHFPRSGGYSSSGIIADKGKNVKSIEIGDRVAVFASAHKSFNVMNENNVIKLSEKNTLQEAAASYISTFSMAAIRKTRLEIGESALVMGLGTLGLFSVAFARAAGAVPVIAVDPVKERREKALKFGADYAFDPFEKDFTKKVKELTDGGVNVAVEVTGVGAGLEECLECMARMGRIALLGCTRNKNFTIDYYNRIHCPGITVIGAHTCARPTFDSHPGCFTHRDDIKSYLNLCANGRINFADMIEEVHSPKECDKVYTRLVNESNFPNIVQFDWSKI